MSSSWGQVGFAGGAGAAWMHECGYPCMHDAQEGWEALTPKLLSLWPVPCDVCPIVHCDSCHGAQVWSASGAGPIREVAAKGCSSVPCRMTDELLMTAVTREAGYYALAGMRSLVMLRGELSVAVSWSSWRSCTDSAWPPSCLPPAAPALCQPMPPAPSFPNEPRTRSIW